MRDDNSFRERFKRWKKGGKPYKNGQIIRDTDMMDERVEQTPVQSDIPYPMLTSRDYDDARAWKLGYFQDAGANGHLWTRDYKTGRYLKSATHPTTGMAAWEDMKEGYDVYQRNGQLYSQPNFSTQKEIERNKKNQINVPNLPGYESGKPGDPPYTTIYKQGNVFTDDLNRELEVVNKMGSEDPSQWVYANGNNVYTPHGGYNLDPVEVKPDWDAVARYKVQGEINPAETNPIKQAWNNYTGELKYNLNQGKLPTSPQYIYPAAALGAGAIMQIPNMLKMTPSAFLGRGAYNTVLGGTGRSLGGALGDAALGSYFGAEGIQQFKENPSVANGVIATLGLLPLAGSAAKGLQQIKNPWTNPKSLLSRNIRTSFYNMKEPLRYNWYDPNNVTPYIYGALNTAIGRTVRQNPVPIMFKTAPMIQPDVVNNRMAAWAKYLGVDDNISLQKPSFFNDEVVDIGPYIKRADGSFGVNLTQEEREPYVTNLIHNANKQLRDIVLGNHGGMGYSLKINDNAEFPATLEFSDVWDLQPFKEIKQFPSWLRNLEASQLLPAGAKPFTYRGSVAVSRKNMDRILESMKYPPEFEKIDYGTYNHMPDLFPTKSPNEGGGIFSNVMRFINSPLTGNWARFGGKEYRFKPGVLGMNGTPIESREVSAPYEIQRYPGYQLKMLLEGNPLEKQLSKIGTVNVNNVKALAAKGSSVEKAVIDEVLASEQFAGQKSIDYNAFRKAVQDRLIAYERVPSTKFEEYGLQTLGMKKTNTPDYKSISDLIDLYKDSPKFKSKWSPAKYGDNTYYYDMENPFATPKDEYTIGKWIEEHLADKQLELNTFTFESPKIPIGNGKHYNTSTLGHTRTYTTTEEPEILHVMESQSDWGQHKFDKPYGEILKAMLKGPDPQAQYLHDNYLQRQLQENLKYAAEHGQTKMRYPTPETVAKIEGYQDGQYETILKKYSDFPKLFNKLYKKSKVRPVTDKKGNTWYEVDVPHDYLNQEWQFKHGKDALPGFGGGKPGIFSRASRLITWGPTLGFVMNQEGGTQAVRGKGKHQITRDPGDGVEAVGYGVRDPYWVNLARKNGGLTESEARQAAIQSLENNRRTLSKYGWYNGLPTDARMVVDDIAYQIGTGTLLNKSPKFIAAVESGNWAEAARQMDWGNRQKSYDGKKMPGVVKRNLDRQAVWNKAFNINGGLGWGDSVRNIEIPMMAPVDTSMYIQNTPIRPLQSPKIVQPEIVVPEQAKPTNFGYWGSLAFNKGFRQQLGSDMMSLINE